MKKSLSKNMINTIEFRKETNLYLVEPLVLSTVCWSDISDVNDMNKATSLHFSELKGKELYAKYVRIDEKSTYWKLYIKGVNHIDVVYVPTFALNPVEM